MLHYEASLAGFAERYGRGETSHTIHVWWARRPHSAMRALVFASLCQDTSDRAAAVLRDLSFASADSPALVQARRMLFSQYNGAPRLLDMFGGGGTIPMEALNLGAEAHAIDANQLSVFIQRCNLTYVREMSKDACASLLSRSGQRVLKQLTAESARLFPLRGSGSFADDPAPFGYLWSYSMKCPSCGYNFFLSKRPWLSKKQGRCLALRLDNRAEAQRVSIGKASEGERLASVWRGRNGTVQCPRCGAKHAGISVKNCTDELVAMVRPAGQRGKEFVLPSGGALPDPGEVERTEKATVEALGVALPSSSLPRWSGIVNPALYGIQTHADFLNRRQRTVLLLLIKALREEYERLQEEQGEPASRAIIAPLSSLIDQLVDWNCRLSMWIPQNEQVGRAFCGPGVSMLWDYAETDPMLDGPANLWAKLDRIISGAKSIVGQSSPAHVRHGYAQALPFPDEYFDAIVTDPPYYDNIFYNVLADFFYAWKRLLLAPIEPDLFDPPATDDSHELVASKCRSQTAEKAHQEYCAQLTEALREAERVLKLNGVFSLVYSHSSLKGWEAIVRAYRTTSFTITSVQPLSIERKQRPRAMTSEAVNTCVAFVAHKSSGDKPTLPLSKLQQDLRAIAGKLAPQLAALNWDVEDIAVAVFAHGVAMLANAGTVSGVPDETEALRALKSVVKEAVPSFKVQESAPLWK